jgi:hypothetical protein
VGANWIVGCTQSHTNFDDPIVFPGQTGASHEHLFVGSRSTSANSTPQSMRASGTTCAMPGDKSGYWIPKPVAGYQVHASKGALFYYSGSVNARPFPDGLRVVVGNAKATSVAENPAIAAGQIKWKCGPGSEPYFKAPPAQCGSAMLTPTVTLPQYWDGVRLDSPDHFSHMSYRRDAAHPIELIKIVAYFRLNVGTGPINPNLSSGPYYTMHLDFLNAWDPTELQRFVDQCIKTGKNCGQNPA